MGHGIRLSEMVEKKDLKNVNHEEDLSEKDVHIHDVNGPALQLAGFVYHMDTNRVQSAGHVGNNY